MALTLLLKGVVITFFFFSPLSPHQGWLGGSMKVLAAPPWGRDLAPGVWGPRAAALGRARPPPAEGRMAHTNSLRLRVPEA